MLKATKRNGAGKKAHSEGRSLWGHVAIWSLAFILGTVMAAFAIFFGWALPLAWLCALLFFAVWRQSRAAQRERRAVLPRLDKLAAEREAVIDVLCGAFGLRENVKMEQYQRVAHLATVVAWQMGLREEEMRLVKKAAILHDVGKIGIAEDVLSKQGELSEQEWAVMKRHPEVGFQLLGPIDFLRDVAEVVHSHHERFDGQGYPRGLKGDQIPIASRIFAVVDSYAAMTSDRPYRKKVPHDIAVKEIVRNSLTQFDPEVVSAFLEAERSGLLNEEEPPNKGRLIQAAARSEV